MLFVALTICQHNFPVLKLPLKHLPAEVGNFRTYLGVIAAITAVSSEAIAVPLSENYRLLDPVVAAQ